MTATTLNQLRDLIVSDPDKVITVERRQWPVTGTVEQIVGQLGMPQMGGSYYTFSDENNYQIWAYLKNCFRTRLDLQRARCHALVCALWYRHQPS